jgi:hypothetical protein
LRGFRKLTQAFVSTILKQLTEPPISTVLLNSSKLVINPHHDVSADRNQPEIFGVDLPAFLLSKSVCPDPVRALQHSAEALLPWWLSASRTQARFRTLALLTDRLPLPQIKNPASSAGLSHHTGGSARSSTNFYPVLVKNLTIGSTSGLRLIVRWEDASSTRL